MSHIEQAIFTSSPADRTAGHQVVAASAGICQADREELAAWGPAHDSLLESGPDAASINFHPLPSGAFCVSRSVPAGWECGGRGGQRTHTQCLVVPPGVLDRFANNPFALLRVAAAGGALRVNPHTTGRLEPLELPGRAVAVDQFLLDRLAEQLGPQRMAALVQAALDSFCLAVAGPLSAEVLMSGFLACLPPACRTEFSFSTGLKFSSRRPFHMVALPRDPAQRDWLAHQPNVTVLDLSTEPTAGGPPIDGWARLIERALSSGRTAVLATELAKRRVDFTPGDLPALGLQLLEDLDASALEEGDWETGESAPEDARRVGPAEPEASLPGGSENEDNPLLAAPEDEPETPSQPAEHPRRAHAAHQRFEKSAAQATAMKTAPAAPSVRLDPDSPEVMEKLEDLDDTVYDAMAGQSAAMERLRSLWPAVIAQLGAELVAESREQYMRFALGIWDQGPDADGLRDPSRAVVALEVLCVLFDDV